VLLLFVFATAEAFRIIARRRMDVPIAVAVVCPVLSVCTYLPIFRALRSSVIDTDIFRPGLAALYDAYVTMFQPALIPVLVAAFVLLVFLAAKTRPLSTTNNDFPLKAHEVVLSVMLSALPLIVAATAAIATGVFMGRYGLSAVIGFSMLFSSSASWAARRNRALGVVLFALFLVCYGAQWSTRVREAMYGRTSYGLNALRPLKLSSLPAELPLVISSGLLFLEADHYEDAAVAQRLQFLTDRASALAYIGWDGFDAGYESVKKWFPVRGSIVSYREFLKSHKRFLVVASYRHRLEWLPHKLADDGVHLRYLGQYNASYAEVIVLEATVSQPELTRTSALRREMSADASRRTPE
jgi:hypothetical protein